MMKNSRKLLETVNIGNLELKNRIVMPAMHLGYCNQKGINRRSSAGRCQQTQKSF